MPNLKAFISPSKPHPKCLMQFKFNLNIQLLVMLIGLRKEKLLESKIKDNAVVVGHFPRQVLWKELIF